MGEFHKDFADPAVGVSGVVLLEDEEEVVDEVELVLAYEVLQSLQSLLSLGLQHLPEFLGKGELEDHSVDLVLLHVHLLPLEDRVLHHLLPFLLHLTTVVVVILQFQL